MWFNFVFFNEKTAYEMRISDWSSDVCSSDLIIKQLAGGAGFVRLLRPGRHDNRHVAARAVAADADAGLVPRQPIRVRHGPVKGVFGIVPSTGDRKSVVEGKSVSVRVDLGGSRILTQKQRAHIHTNS